VRKWAELRLCPFWVAPHARACPEFVNSPGSHYAPLLRVLGWNARGSGIGLSD